MLWACILLPQLALDTVLRERDDPDTPLVLLGGPTQRRVLQAVSPAAAALGLRAGQTLTAARALAEGFACVEADPRRIEQVQQLLGADWRLDIVEQPDILGKSWKFLKGGATRLVERAYRLQKL